MKQKQITFLFISKCKVFEICSPSLAPASTKKPVPIFLFHFDLDQRFCRISSTKFYKKNWLLWYIFIKTFESIFFYLILAGWIDRSNFWKMVDPSSLFASYWVESERNPSTPLSILKNFREHFCEVKSYRFNILPGSSWWRPLRFP